MLISEHYRPYFQKTFILVCDSHQAKFFSAENREVLEINQLKKDIADSSSLISPDEKENLEKVDTLKFFKVIANELDKMADQCQEIVIVVPDLHKNQLSSELSDKVLAKSKELICKNLASLEIDAIMRIIQEVR
jgi:protein required for attachment to host cells